MNQVKTSRSKSQDLSEQIENAEEHALKEVASFLIHRLRNPLGGIKGFASLLERDLEGQPDHQRLAKMIVDGTNTLDQIMGAILEYAQPLELKLKEEDFIAAVKEVFDKDQISWTASTKELPLQMDGRQMRKALSYLSDVVVHSVKNGGSAIVNLEAIDGNIEIVIADKDNVIPEDRLPKVFSPFFTVPWGGEEGALAQAKKIIRAHKGAIEVDTSKESGTTITIKIPRG